MENIRRTPAPRLEGAARVKAVRYEISEYQRGISSGTWHRQYIKIAKRKKRQLEQELIQLEKEIKENETKL